MLAFPQPGTEGLCQRVPVPRRGAPDPTPGSRNSCWGDTNPAATAPTAPREQNTLRDTGAEPGGRRRGWSRQSPGRDRSTGAGPRRAPALALLLRTAREGPALGTLRDSLRDTEGRAGIPLPRLPPGLSWGFNSDSFGCCSPRFGEALPGMGQCRDSQGGPAFTRDLV